MAAKPVVAGTDGSEESLRAGRWAAREAALRGAPLRIVAAVAAPPGMMSRAGAGEYERVTDIMLGERDQALAAAAQRAAKTASGVLIDTDPLRGPAALAVGDLDTCGDALTFASEEASLRKAGLLAVHARHTPQTGISRADQAFTPPGPRAGRPVRPRRPGGGRGHAKHPGLPGAARSGTPYWTTRTARWSSCPRSRPAIAGPPPATRGGGKP